MNFIQLVEEKKVIARLENIKEVRKDIQKPWVQEKINNHIIRFGGIFKKEDIEKEIMTSDILASVFAKDPAKQNIVEKLVEQVLGLEKLPASGRNCIRFNEGGNIVSASGASHSKSADFMFNGYYATQKFTTESGGAQDNQFYDVVDFLKKGSLSNKVSAIVDGLFWDNGKRDLLKKEFSNNPNVFITSVQEIMDLNEED